MNGLVVFIMKTVDRERLTEPPNEAQESRFCGVTSSLRHAEQYFVVLRRTSPYFAAFHCTSSYFVVVRRSSRASLLRVSLAIVLFSYVSMWNAHTMLGMRGQWKQAAELRRRQCSDLPGN